MLVQGLLIMVLVPAHVTRRITALELLTSVWYFHEVLPTCRTTEKHFTRVGPCPKLVSMCAL